jgi:hypothetical protein
MRRWIYTLMLGAGLMAASIPPAAANGMVSRAPHVALNGQARSPLLRHSHFRHHRAFGPFAFGSPLFFPNDFFDAEGASGAGASRLVMLNDAPGARLRRPAVERASVETTEQGVVIVRGPGSHHIGP